MIDQELINWKEEIREFRALIRRLSLLKTKIADSQSKVNDLLFNLQNDKEMLQQIERDVATRLEQLDVGSRGNAGWESRMLNFLSEIIS